MGQEGGGERCHPALTNTCRGTETHKEYLMCTHDHTFAHHTGLMSQGYVCTRDTQRDVHYYVNNTLSNN